MPQRKKAAPGAAFPQFANTAGVSALVIGPDRGRARRRRSGDPERFGRLAERADFVHLVIVVGQDLLQIGNRSFVQFLRLDRLLGDFAQDLDQGSKCLRSLRQ